ncbi:MAG: PepSY domain-containing protein [Devosia sp.]|nr:PepSY domain-containing protein [Devosia sp.]
MNSALFAAVWRWHFIAGLLVLPVLVMMAITGGAYLFQPELDHLAYRRLEDVPARAAPMASPSVVIPKVEAALQGRVLLITPPARPDRSVRLLVRVSSGETLTAFADPYDGHFIGATPFGGVMQLVRKIHSLQKFGFWASCLIEITAGWAIVLVGTGVFLWWPRGKTQGGVISVRGSPSRRVFWRDLHAVTGVFAAAVILFLAVTGMPWSMFWGAHVQQLATAANLYEPPAPAQVTPDWQMSATMPNMPHAPHGADPGVKAQMPWAMETMNMPMSQDMPGMGPIGVDRAAAIFRTLGLPPSASISLPDGPKGAYVASLRPDRVEDTRVVYLDQYSGKVLGDVGFKDWGPAAKAIEWGIAVHQGQEYGPLNRYVMLAGCVSVVLLAVTSITMWWKRRPKGSLGVPPAPSEPRAARGLVAIMAIVGIIYPLVGASLVAALLVDRGFALAKRGTL